MGMLEISDANLSEPSHCAVQKFSYRPGPYTKVFVGYQIDQIFQTLTGEPTLVTFFSNFG